MYMCIYVYMYVFDFQLLTIIDLPFNISQLLNYFSSLLSNTSQHLQYWIYYIDKIFNLKNKKIEVSIEPWVKNRDTNQIVSLVYRYSLTDVTS